MISSYRVESTKVVDFSNDGQYLQLDLFSFSIMHSLFGVIPNEDDE